MDSATVERLADCRVYSGRQALTVKLIDELGTEVEARQWLTKEKQVNADLETLTREPPATDNKPKLNLSWGKAAADTIITSLGLESLRQKADVAKLDGLLVLWRAGY